MRLCRPAPGALGSPGAPRRAGTCVSGESLGHACFLPRAAQAPTAKYPLLHTPRPGSARGDPLPAELGREPGHSPALVNKLPLPLPEACCLPALVHPPCATHPGEVFPPLIIFFFFCLYRKSLDRAWKGGSPAARRLEASPAASHSKAA